MINTESFEKFASAIAGREITPDIPATQRERIRIACALGYIDARFVVFMHDTCGLPIEITLDRAWKEHKLSPDWKGIETELVLQKGISVAAAKRQTAFIKRDFELGWGKR